MHHHEVWLLFGLLWGQHGMPATHVRMLRHVVRVHPWVETWMRMETRGPLRRMLLLLLLLLVLLLLQGV